MVPELTKYYNIVEPYHDDGYDVGSYLFEHNVRYALQTKTIFEIGDIDPGWMVTIVPTNIVIYTVNITPEEALAIMLIFPNLSISEPKPEFKIRLQELVKKVVE
jgi:hypothetical protein